MSKRKDNLDEKCGNCGDDKFFHKQIFEATEKLGRCHFLDCKCPKFVSVSEKEEVGNGRNIGRNSPLAANPDDANAHSQGHAKLLQSNGSKCKSQPLQSPSKNC
jgi:hypothetical protein